MRRNIDLIIKILDSLNVSKGGNNGYFCIYIGEHGNVHDVNANPIAIPAELCPDYVTLFYHINMMFHAKLVHKIRSEFYEYPACRLEPEGKAFLEGIQELGVLDDIEAIHGDSWRNWPLDIMISIFTEIANIKRNTKVTI